MAKQTKLDAGWYRLETRKGVYEIESVKRMGGGGDPHEWVCYLTHEDKPREWFATTPSFRHARDVCETNDIDPDCYRCEGSGEDLQDEDRGYDDPLPCPECFPEYVG